MGNSSQQALVPGPCESLISGDVRKVPQSLEKSDIFCVLELDGTDADAGFALLGKDGTLEAVHAKDRQKPGVEYWPEGPGAFIVRLSDVSSNAQALLFMASARPPARHPFSRRATGSATLKHVTRDLCKVKIDLTPESNSVVLLGFHRSADCGWHMEVVAKCYSLFHENPYHALQPILLGLTSRAEHLRPKDVLGFAKASLKLCGGRLSNACDSEVIGTGGANGQAHRQALAANQRKIDRCDTVTQQCRASQICFGTPLIELDEPMDAGGTIHAGVGVLDFNGDGAFTWDDLTAAVFLDNPAEPPPIPDLSAHHWRNMQDAYKAQMVADMQEAQEERLRKHKQDQIGSMQKSQDGSWRPPRESALQRGFDGTPLAPRQSGHTATRTGPPESVSTAPKSTGSYASSFSAGWTTITAAGTAMAAYPQALAEGLAEATEAFSQPNPTVGQPQQIDSNAVSQTHIEGPGRCAPLEPTTNISESLQPAPHLD